MLEKIGESLKETHFTATTVDSTKLPIHGKASLQLHIGALRWKPKLPTKNIKGLDFILGRGFLKRFNPEIDWVNWKACIYNNGNQVELRSWWSCVDTRRRYYETAPTLQSMTGDSNGTLPRGTLVMAAVEEKESNSELSAAVQKVLEQYKDIMPDDLPAGVLPARTHEHEIVEEPGAKPVSRAPYRLSPTELTDMKKHIEYLLDRQLIRPSTSPYGAPVIFTPKPDGSLRIVFEAGPTVALLADQDGRQLSPHDGVPYQLRLLQVLSDAVRTLQRTDGVLGRDESHPTAPAGRVRGGVSGRHSHLLLEHEGARGAFAEILRDPAGEQVLREAVDSEFTLKKVQFLRHMVSVEGVHVDPRKIEAVKKWKVPENVKELQLLQQVRATVL
ncbi:unnamed protein product [Closterium sp. NIES-53]